MSYNLFLDDLFNPIDIANLTTSEKNREYYRKENWIIVRNYDDFCKTIIEKGIPYIVSFDHDLAPEHHDLIFFDENWFKNNEDIVVNYDVFEIKCGYHACEFLLEYIANHNLKTPIMLVHSQNAVGKRNIENLIY